ncbi:uncharacterized protein LOC141639033 isoform X1 [Silene latifolia]|uniref:uncharacterized protein LOC141639033 isoform X1 n=1 Tax=Silene latifolia TaxID=37657 RepID=UPI003D76BBCA
MAICQICGDEGYVKLLTHCVQCQNVAAHRYCVLNPSIFEETIKWLCEFCDPGNTKPTTPIRKGQDINSTVQQVVQPKTDQAKLGNNLCLSESEKPNNGQKEIPRESTDIFILDQNKDNSSKRKQVKRSDDVKKDKINYDSGIKDSCQAVQVKEQSVTNVSQSNTNAQRQVNLGSIVCALLAKEDEVIMGGTKLVKRQNVTRSLLPKKGGGAANLDKSSCEVYSKQMELNKSQPDTELAYPAEDRKSEVEETIAEFVKRKQAKQLVGVKKIKQSNYDNGVEKEGSVVGQVKEKNTKNVSLSVTNGHQQVNKEKNAGPLLSKVEDAITESTCKAGHSIQGGTKLVNQQKPTNRLVAKKCDGETTFDKSSSEFSSKQMQKLHINKSQSDAKLADHADDSKSEGKEIAAKFVQRKQVKPLVDVTKVKKIKQSNYDNGVKKDSFEAHQVKEQSVKNASLSDTNGHRQVNLGKNLGPLLTKVKDNVITEGTCKAGHCIQGGTKLLEQKKPTSGLATKKGDGASSLDKSSCQVSPKQMKEVHMNESQPDAEEADYANKKKSEFKEITAEFVKRQAPRKKRKFIIEMEYSDEDPVFVVAKHSQVVAHVGQDHLSKSTSEALSKLSDDGLAQLSSIDSVPPRPSPVMADERGLTLESSVVFDNRIPVETQNLVHNVPALPLNEVAWSGYCSIPDNEYPMSLALGAHLSNKAHENVKGAVCALPESLEFYLVSKTYAWPKTFESSPPTADVIGLYFFPIDDRSEKLYDYLVDKMIEDSLVLKALLNYVELLVFCSLELPPEERSLRRKYYLWGVFKPRKDYAIPNNQPNAHISKKDSIYQQEDASTLTHPEYRSTRCFSETHFPREALAESVETTLPESPYPAYNNSSRTFSNTHFRQEAMVESVELTRPYTESLYQSDDKQGHDIHDGGTRIFQKPQELERRNRFEHRKYAERNQKYRKSDARWNQGSRKRKDRDWRSSRYHSKRSYNRIDLTNR